MRDEGGRMKDEGTAVQLSLHPSSFRLHPCVYAFSSPAYFSTSFFWPKPGKLTKSLAPSPTPSRRSTRPRPYFGWRTCVPGVKPPPDVEDEEAADERPAPLGRPPPGGAEGRDGCVGGGC